MKMYRRPGALTRLMNRAFGWLASLGLTPGRNVTLEVRGRRSGEVRSVPVNIVEVDGQQYLASPRGETEWVRNVRAANGQAVIRHGRRREVRLEELPEAERAPVLKRYVQENRLSTGRHFEVSPDAPIEEFQRIADRHPVFRVLPPE